MIENKRFTNYNKTMLRQRGTENMKNTAQVSQQNILTAKRKKRSEFYKYWQYRYLTLMLVFTIAYYIIFHYVPMYGIQIAFKSYKLRLGIWGSPWIGFQNFIDLFSVGSFWEVLGNTLIISFYKLVFGFPAPIILAILLNEVSNVFFKKSVQTISYLPHFVSWVVLGGLFLQLLSPSSGPVNSILNALGIKPIYFLADPKWFRTVLVVTGVWKEIGWGSIIYLAAITGIDPEIYEAATVDGANRLQRIRHITIPSLAPVVTIMLIFAIGGIIKDDFDQIFNLMNSPTVYQVGDVLSTYTYRMGMVQMEYSFATAVGLFKNIIAFVLIMITNTVTKRINEYGIW